MARTIWTLGFPRAFLMPNSGFLFTELATTNNADAIFVPIVKKSRRDHEITHAQLPAVECKRVRSLCAPLN
jgi:hypothetical protein